jgi:hypothetical protein
MSLPKLDLAILRHYCEQRVPPDAIDQVRVELEVSRGAVTIVERRPPWRADYRPEWTRLGIARFRYANTTGLWTLYWRDRNQSWHIYDLVEPATHIGPLLDEVDGDPTGIFWG